VLLLDFLQDIAVFVRSFLNRRALELLPVEQKKKKKKSDSDSAGPLPKKAVRPEDFELVLSDPLLKDGVMRWPLGEVTTVGFLPGKLSICLLFYSSYVVSNESEVH
jgi:hypothetical protein